MNAWERIQFPSNHLPGKEPRESFWRGEDVEGYCLSNSSKPIKISHVHLPAAGSNALERLTKLLPKPVWSHMKQGRLVRKYKVILRSTLKKKTNYLMEVGKLDEQDFRVEKMTIPVAVQSLKWRWRLDNGKKVTLSLHVQSVPPLSPTTGYKHEKKTDLWTKMCSHSLSNSLASLASSAVDKNRN